MNTDAIQKILDEVCFPGWTWKLRPTYEGHLLQGCFQRPERDSGEMGEGSSRWEFLGEECTEDSIVKTAWVLVMLTVQHEAMEFFTYAGRRVFDPHTPVSALIGLQEAH